MRSGNLIDFITLEENIKKGNIENSYIMFGFNEKLIKGLINNIVDRIVEPSFKELNYFQFDGYTSAGETIINACETLPFMSEKKIVVVFRAVFLDDETKQLGVNSELTFKQISEYLPKVPPYTTLILYYVFKDKREKLSKKINSLKNKCTMVEFKLLKGEILNKKVKAMFNEKGKEIGKVELNLFCSEVENNIDIINNEIEKLICYTIGREIKKEDIISIGNPKSDNDIFNLVDSISIKNTKHAMDILNEIMFRGEKFGVIISMIIRQYKILLNMKLSFEIGRNISEITKELYLNPYIAEKMAVQSKKYTNKQIIKVLECCINCEKKLKSTTTNIKTELELLLINIARV